MKTFREIYCEKNGCTDSRFEHELLWRCFYPHARPLLPFMKVMSKQYFTADLELINDVGYSTGRQGVKDAIDSYFHHPANVGFLRRRLRVRISTNAIRHLARQMWDSY